MKAMVTIMITVGPVTIAVVLRSHIVDSELTVMAPSITIECLLLRPKYNCDGCLQHGCERSIKLFHNHEWLEANIMF